MGEGKGENSLKQRGREANHKRLLNTENKLRADVGAEGGTHIPLMIWASLASFQQDLECLREQLGGFVTGCPW